MAIIAQNGSIVNYCLTENVGIQVSSGCTNVFVQNVEIHGCLTFPPHKLRVRYRDRKIFLKLLIIIVYK